MTKKRSTPKNPPRAADTSAWNAITPRTAKARKPSMPTMREDPEVATVAACAPGSVESVVRVGTRRILPQWGCRVAAP